MATLSIRNLPDHVHAALRVRAAQAGRSMEAEARRILMEAVRPIAPDAATELQSYVASLYEGAPPEGVVDEFIAERRREAHTEP